MGEPAPAAACCSLARVQLCWDAQQPAGQRIVPGSVTLDGRPVAADARVQVTVNGFLAGGGDNFSVLTEGRDRQTSMVDLEALEAYLKAHPRLAPGTLDRVKRLH